MRTLTYVINLKTNIKYSPLDFMNNWFNYKTDQICTSVTNKIDKEYQPILEEIEKEVEYILRKVFNYGAGIGDMNISMSEDTTYVDFDYTCRGYTDRESEGFPTELLFQTDEFIDNYNKYVK